MERKSRRKSLAPEQTPQKELWEEKGWSKKLHHEEGYTKYDGRFVAYDGDIPKDYYVGAIIDWGPDTKKVDVLIKLPPPGLPHSTDEFNLYFLNKMRREYVIRYHQNSPQTVNQAIIQTEQLLARFV